MLPQAYYGSDYPSPRKGVCGWALKAKKETPQTPPKQAGFFMKFWSIERCIDAGRCGAQLIHNCGTLKRGGTKYVGVAYGRHPVCDTGFGL